MGLLYSTKYKRLLRQSSCGSLIQYKIQSIDKAELLWVKAKSWISLKEYVITYFQLILTRTTNLILIICKVPVGVKLNFLTFSQRDFITTVRVEIEMKMACRLPYLFSEGFHNRS